MCVSAAGGPPPSPRAERPGAVQPVAHAPLWPDLVVTNAWIGPGDPPPGLYALLGRSPWVGETVTLGCEVAIKGNVRPNSFKVAWVVDGAKTCGEGDWTLGNAPACEFTWPFSNGAQAAITWVPHTAGAHTFECRVDTAHEVRESDEVNNVRGVGFSVIARAKELGPLTAKPLPKSPYGLKLRTP